MSGAWYIQCCAVVLEWLVAVLEFGVRMPCSIIASAESGKWRSVVQPGELSHFWKA